MSGCARFCQCCGLLGLVGWQVSASMISALAAETVEAGASGMITIEIVENPGFFELYGTYVYLGVIALFLAAFFWRRAKQGRKSA